jgi:hypothetical protein
MGEVREPKPAKLFMSLMTSEEAIFRDGIEDLRSTFGEIDFISERLPFDFTDYYAEEMGRNLSRYFITFERLLSIPALPEIKETTHRLEEKYVSPSGKRRINIDPGYLCLAHVILATHKAYTHRPYLRKGVYADLTLIFRARSFRPLDWTYPDYRREEVINLFNRFREKYLQDLRREL